MEKSCSYRGLAGLFRSSIWAIPSGKQAKTRTPANTGHGKAIRLWPRSMPRAIRLAARSALIRNGIGNGFFSVIGLLIKPGQIT